LAKAPIVRERRVVRPDKRQGQALSCKQPEQMTVCFCRSLLIMYYY
jgi:hypothetical protein